MGTPAKKPTIGLACIVKNEKVNIPRLVESVKPFIDSWCIIDTGSDDGTPEAIWEALGDLPGVFKESEFVNFAHNRTELVNLARNLEDFGVPQPDYLFLLDADHTLDVDPGALDNLTGDGYFLRLGGPMEYWMPYLVKADLPWKYIGVTHEFLSCDDAFILDRLPGVFVNHYADGGTRPEKYERDEGLLRQAMADNPDDDRTVFYLAQTLADTGRTNEAWKLYLKRADMGGFAEEAYISLIRGADLTQDDVHRVWLYLRAINQRPSRPEAYLRLAQFYRNRGDHATGAIFARAGAELPASEDLLFLERWAQDFGLAFEYGICIWWLGRKEEAKVLFEKLLEIPDLSQQYKDAVNYNLSFC